MTSCGVGFVADMKNRKSHDILEKGLQILVNLDHRGAVGADPSLGDGCGVLTQIPHAFFAPECAKLGFDLPAQGHYAIGQFFMPRGSRAPRQQVREIVEEVVAAEGLDRTRLARCARRQFRAWRTRQGGRAGDAADFHRTPSRTSPAKTILSGGSMSCARSSPIAWSRSGRRRSSNITRSRCPLAPLSTRAWCWCASLRRITVTYWTRVTRPPWRWSINGLRPTRFRPGVLRTLIGQSRTTAKSTRCGATSTGWRRVRRASTRNCSAPTSRSCGRFLTKASRTPPASTMRSSSSFRVVIRSATR